MVGGAWAIEKLTDDIERRALEKIAAIRASKGMLPLIEKGDPQSEIHERAYQFQSDVESGRRKIVGVNVLKEGGENSEAKILKVSLKLEKEAVSRLKKFKKNRVQAHVDSSLKNLEESARGRENLFPLILSCAENRATLGEICGVLRTVFGEYHGG